MKTGDYSQARSLVEHFKNDERVEEVNARSISFYPGLDGVEISYGGRVLELISEARTQFLNNVVGGGAGYVYKFASDSPDDSKLEMLEHCRIMIQDRLDRENKEVQVHAIDDTVFGVTSTRYTKVYDEDIMNILDINGMKFKKLWFCNNLTAIDYEVSSFLDPSGQKFISMFRVENNQWGRHSLAIKPMIEREWCSNGATAPVFGFGKKRIRHVGNINLGGILDIVNEYKNNLDVMEDFIRKSWELEIEDLDSYFKKLGNKFHVSKKDINNIKRYLGTEENQDTAYSVANAVSRLANDKEDVETMIQFQEIAGFVYSTPTI